MNTRSILRTLFTLSFITLAIAATHGAPGADKTSYPKTDERQAAEWALTVGGSIAIQEGAKPPYKLTSKAGLPKGRFQLREVILDGKKTSGPVTGESLKVLAGLPDLLSLELVNLELTDEELMFIGTLSNLNRVLITDDRKLTGAVVKDFARLRSLDMVFFANTSFSDESAALLADCRGLSQVDLSGCEAITDASIPSLNKLTRLRRLWVSGTKMTPEGLAGLKTKLDELGMNLVPGESIKPVVAAVAPKQPQLSTVTLNHAVANDSLALLKDFPRLTTVEIRGNASDSLLDGLAVLPGLEALVIGVPFKLTDAGLMKIVPLKKLKTLTILSKTVTDAGVAAFKKARPNVVVKR